jgi:host factor-I protein
MTDFNTGLPSTRQVQTFIKDKQQVEFKLSTADTIVGQIRWQDDHCFCVVDGAGRSFTIARHAVVYYTPQS